MEKEQVGHVRPLAPEGGGPPPPSDRLLRPDEAAALHERVTLNGHFRFELEKKLMRDVAALAASAVALAERLMILNRDLAEAGPEGLVWRVGELKGRGIDLDRQLDAIDQQVNTLRDYDRSVQTEE